VVKLLTISFWEWYVAVSIQPAHDFGFVLTSILPGKVAKSKRSQESEGSLATS
jgi:hypothetical protein